VRISKKPRITSPIHLLLQSWVVTVIIVHHFGTRYELTMNYYCYHRMRTTFLGNIGSPRMRFGKMQLRVVQRLYF
jgi:hypothetical protein